MSDVAGQDLSNVLRRNNWGTVLSEMWEKTSDENEQLRNICRRVVTAQVIKQAEAAQGTAEANLLLEIWGSSSIADFEAQTYEMARKCLNKGVASSGNPAPGSR